jgi:hypothetical protein
MKFYAIEEGDLAKVRGVAKRLFTETRMNGDEMRDAAQALDYVLRQAGEIELPISPPGPITPEEQDSVSAAICERRFSWCRSRLLHALAGAAEQGVLLEVLKELLPETGDVFHAMFVSTLTATGWMKGKEAPATSNDGSDRT